MTETKTRLQKYSAPALEKGLDILELLSLKSGEGLNQSEIAEGVGRSKNEIFRMMVVLEERGYIRRSEGDVFALTSRLEEVFGRRNDTARMLEVVEPFMAKLSAQTEKSNHLWILKESRMQVALRSHVPEAYSLSLAEGSQGQIFGTSAGACFLSGFADAKERFIALQDHGEFVSEEEFAQFDADVRACAEEKVIALRNADTPTILELSAPIEAQGTGNVVAALSIPTISIEGFENEVATLKDALKKTAGLISDRLAYLSVLQDAPS